MRVLLTGSSGLIGGYLTRELLARGYDVTGIDRSARRKGTSGCRLIEGDAATGWVLDEALADCDHFIACAAMTAGLAYLRSVPLDLLIANERLTIAACEAAVRAHKAGRLRKVTWMSSSIVYESATSWPSAEGDELRYPPPPSAYGFQKMSVEYFARAAWTQHQLPYTIIRPFNVVGVRDYPPGGRADASRLTSQVIPDLIGKVLSGQDPLRILGDGSQVRSYTWAGDLARGIAMSLDHPRALNEDFNISRPDPVTVAELAQMIWLKIKGPDVPFRLAGDSTGTHDTQRRVPDAGKARDLLGFTASTSLGEMLDAVIPSCREAVADGRL